MHVLPSWLRSALAVSVLLGSLSGIAVAQTQSGTITGVVTDEQGSVLPGVLVSIGSPVLIRPQSTVTNDRGVYSFIALPPGEYWCVSSSPGSRRSSAAAFASA